MWISSSIGSICLTQLRKMANVSVCSLVSGRMKYFNCVKGLFTPSDSVTIIVALTGCTFDFLDGHCDGHNGLHTHFACQCNICYGVV